MPNFVSPGVYIIEKDISDYPAQINSSVVGIVGFAWSYRRNQQRKSYANH